MGKNPHCRSSLHWLPLLWRHIWPPAGSLPPGDHPPPPPPGRDLLQVEGCRTVPPLGYISRHRQVMVTPHGRPWRGGRGSRSCPLMPSPLTPVASWRMLDAPPRGSWRMRDVPLGGSWQMHAVAPRQPRRTLLSLVLPLLLVCWKMVGSRSAGAGGDASGTRDPRLVLCQLTSSDAASTAWPETMLLLHVATPPAVSSVVGRDTKRGSASAAVLSGVVRHGHCSAVLLLLFVRFVRRSPPPLTVRARLGVVARRFRTPLGRQDRNLRVGRHRCLKCAPSTP